MIFLILLFLTFGTIFTLFRLIFYGAFCSVLIELADTAESVMKLREQANEEMVKNNPQKYRFLEILPLSYWSSGLSFKRGGFWVSMIVAAAISALLFIVFFLE